VWHILDDGEFALVLANAAHVKNVPGRKTDVNDAMWLAELLAHGLIRASFVPDAQMRAIVGRQPLRQAQKVRRGRLEGANFGGDLPIGYKAQARNLVTAAIGAQAAPRGRPGLRVGDPLGHEDLGQP
jgi:transposase